MVLLIEFYSPIHTQEGREEAKPSLVNSWTWLISISFSISTTGIQDRDRRIMMTF